VALLFYGFVWLAISFVMASISFSLSCAR